ncbi:MAG: segregation and condensation protein A [Thiohalophilus sp.]
MSRDEYSKEEQILQVMRKVLTDVAKDTYTKPGLKHPLSEETIISIRDCLGLIASREKELADEAGRPSQKRPRYVDEPQKSTVIPIDTSGLKKKKKSPDSDSD